jgi:ornithine carbamoyltransferase
MRNLRTLFDITPEEAVAILERAADLKAQFKVGERPPLLQDHVLTQIFDKPSLRTRLSFDAAMVHLGGESSFYTGKDAGLQGRESLPDIARVVSSFSDVVVLRTFSQDTINEFCKWSSVPVINGLSDDFHPCQALTDFLTIREEFGGLNGQRLVFVGDGNNVSASLCVLSGMLKQPMTLAVPKGYELPDDFVSDVRSRFPHLDFTQTNDPIAAVKQADIIYTDVWASMGQEEESRIRAAAFADFQVNAELFSHAPSHAKFMHDLPAKRGLEVTDEIMDGPRSIVFQQAENRMHLAKGLLVWLLDK